MTALAVSDDVDRLLANGRLAMAVSITCFITFMFVATMAVRSVVDINGPAPTGAIISSNP